MEQIRNSLETFMQGDTLYGGLFNVEMSEGQIINIFKKIKIQIM